MASCITQPRPNWIYALEKSVNDWICSIYVTRSQAIPWDALAFIQKPKERTLQLPLAAKQQWLKSFEVAMACKEHHEYGQYLSKQQDNLVNPQIIVGRDKKEKCMI